MHVSYMSSVTPRSLSVNYESLRFNREGNSGPFREMSFIREGFGLAYVLEALGFASPRMNVKLFRSGFRLEELWCFKVDHCL